MGAGAVIFLPWEIKCSVQGAICWRQWQVPSYDPPCVALSVEEDGHRACWEL